MSHNDLAYATLQELTALFAKRKLSPVEVTQHFLQRIERLNPRLNAYLTVTAERALADARRAEREWLRGTRAALGRPLLGIPIALKDNIWTRGIRTTAGSLILRDFVPTEDATVVRKLTRAGAVLLGKAHLHEFAYGATNVNVHYGPAHNPWDLERITGGSSGGSAAAITAGLCTLAVGSDTGGSIRIPASLCGIVGLKPTFGRVSVHGTIPLAPSLDHVGPLARSVTDAAIMLGAMAGPDRLDPTAVKRPAEDFAAALRKPLKKFRLGFPSNYFWDALDPEVRRLAEAAVRDLEKHGAMVSKISLPGVQEAVDSATHMAVAETRYFHESAGYYPARASEYSDDARRRLEAGAAVRAIDYLAARDAQRRLRATFDAAFLEVDAVVAPATMVPAPPIGAEDVRIGNATFDTRTALLRLNRPANFTGYPAISIPCGFTPDGLPVGLELMGRPFDEATLLRIALVYEGAHPWKARHPKLN